MKSFLSLAVLFTTAFGVLTAQDFVQISAGAGYSNQAFYSLESQSSVEVSNDSWDLVFTTFGQQDAGVHVNEASSSTFGAPAPTVELYRTDALELAEVTVFDTLFTRVYNDEENWAFGALNDTRNKVNPFDYGWGAYDPTSRTVLGEEVFVIKLRSGEFKKFKIESLVFTTYNITFSNLDGSDETTVAIDKTNYPNGLAYFSFDQGGTIDLSVGRFDLLFTRYVTPLLDPSTGDILNYTVTGILNGLGVEVAKVVGADPAVVAVETVPDSFSTRLDVIGYDWKTFDFSGGWLLADSTTYIVKTPSSKLYKLVFIDFEGSSTGVATFEQSELGTISAISSLNSAFETFNVFPNPVGHSLNVVYGFKNVKALTQISLFNLLGQKLWSVETESTNGLNALELQLPQLANGQYLLSVETNNSVITKQITVYQ